MTEPLTNNLVDVLRAQMEESEKLIGRPFTGSRIAFVFAHGREFVVA